MVMLGLSQTTLVCNAAEEGVTVRATDTSNWQRFVGGFRKNHNFAVVVGRASNRWYVRDFGTIGDEHIESKAAYAKFQYSFHIPFSRSFGALLGSSTGYYFESLSDGSGFRAGPAIHLPGVLAGLVFNPTPVWRILVTAESYLERIETLRNTSVEPQEVLQTTMLTYYDFGLMIDFFYSLNWAVRAEGHYKYSANHPPARGQGVIEGSVQKYDLLFGMGLVYHLL